MPIRVFVLYFCLFSAAWGQRTQYVKDIYAGLGTLTQFAGQVQTDTSGGMNSFTFTPYLMAGVQVPIYRNFYLLPEIGFLIPKGGADEKINRFDYFVRGDAALEFYPLLVRLGATMMWQTIGGSGGTKTLNNGTGTSDFFVPSDYRTAQLLTVDLGLEVFLIRSLSVRSLFQVHGLFNSIQRSYSYGLQLSYHFGSPAPKAYNSPQKIKRKRRLKKRKLRGKSSRSLKRRKARKRAK